MAADASAARSAQLDAEGEMFRLKGAIRAVGNLMSHMGGKGVDPEGEDLFLLMEVIGVQAVAVEDAYRHARALSA